MIEDENRYDGVDRLVAISGTGFLLLGFCLQLYFLFENENTDIGPLCTGTTAFLLSLGILTLRHTNTNEESLDDTENHDEEG